MTPVPSLPIVIIPGLQGRWEWMRPAIEALRGECGNVSTFSLNEEDGSGDPFDQWMSMIERRVERSDSGRIVLIGVSFGGLVAVRYAARYPERVGALVLVSAPSPGQRLSPFDESLLRNPVSRLPLFAMRGVRRLAPEIVAAKDTWRERLRFTISYGYQVLSKPV